MQSSQNLSIRALIYRQWKRVFTSSCTCAKSHPGNCSPLKDSIVSDFADNGPDQTARMRGLNWTFAVCRCPKTRFRMALTIILDAYHIKKKEKKKKKKKKNYCHFSDSMVMMVSLGLRCSYITNMLQIISIVYVVIIPPWNLNWPSAKSTLCSYLGKTTP